MNDVRKLLQTLAGDIEYREFTQLAPTAPPASWAVLHRLDESAARAQPVQLVQPPVAAEPALAVQLQTAAVARSARAGRATEKLSLGHYRPAAAAPAAPAQSDPRRLALADVFSVLDAKPAR